MKNLFLFFSLFILAAFGAVADSPCIVPEQIAEIKSLHFAVDFLNRYVDYLQTPKTEANAGILRRAKEDGLKFIKGNDATLATVNADMEFNISFNNGVYNASWKDNGKTLAEVSFPANITLLTFSDKKNLEKLMAKKLSSLPSKAAKEPLPTMDIAQLRPVSYSDMMVLDKGYFIAPRLQNITVFTRNDKGSDCELFMTKSGPYIMEAIQNMMLTGYSESPIDINIELTEYGYKSSKFNKPLEEVYNLFISEGSVPYWGWESNETKNIKGLYVWKNEEGGFVHVLTVTMPADIMNNGGDIDAKLHCYVRMDNVKSLFEEYM